MEKLKLLLVLVFFIGSCAVEENGFIPCTEIDQNNQLNHPKETFTTQSSSGDSLYDILVYRARYRGNTVFVAMVCCPSCNAPPPEVRNRGGQLIGYLGVDIDYDILQNADVICRTHNGVCP